MDMWESPTRYWNRFGLSQARLVLVNKVCSYFDIPAKGVVFVFEKEDYQECYYDVWRFNPEWRKLANHLNIRVGGVEEISPEHLLKLMKSCKYANLVWICRKACETPEDIDFAWILAHELRHLEQDLSSRTLSKAGHFLQCAQPLFKAKELKAQVTIPTELDANLRAYRVTKEEFGSEDVKAYLRNEFLANDRQELFETLERCHHGKRYDVFRSTVALLRKYRSQLKEFQNRSADESIARFDLTRCAQN
jgi:hypothetical protein